jgi:hypothetical protein
MGNLIKIRMFILFVCFCSLTSWKCVNNIVSEKNIISKQNLNEKDIITFLQSFISEFKKNKSVNMDKYLTLEGRDNILTITDNLKDKNYFTLIDTALNSKQFKIEIGRNVLNPKIYGAIVSLGERNDVLGYRLGSFFIQYKNHNFKIYKINLPK